MDNKRSWVEKLLIVLMVSKWSNLLPQIFRLEDAVDGATSWPEQHFDIHLTASLLPTKLEAYRGHLQRTYQYAWANDDISALTASNLLKKYAERSILAFWKALWTDPYSATTRMHHQD